MGAIKTTVEDMRIWKVDSYNPEGLSGSHSEFTLIKYHLKYRKLGATKPNLIIPKIAEKVNLYRSEDEMELAGIPRFFTSRSLSARVLLRLTDQFTPFKAFGNWSP